MCKIVTHHKIGKDEQNRFKYSYLITLVTHMIQALTYTHQDRNSSAPAAGHIPNDQPH